MIVAIRGNASLTQGTRLGKYSFMYLEEASAPVPEPGSILLLEGGLGAIVIRRRNRN